MHNMTKNPILFLCHRIPYPPNKGDKIRSFNILKALSQQYSVDLVAFVDDENDWQYAEELKTWCASVNLYPLSKRLATMRSSLGLISNKALTLPYFYNSSKFMTN